MAIGIVTTYLPRDRMGGAQLQAVRMAQELGRRHDVTLFARGDQGADADAGLDGVRVVLRNPPDIPGVRLLVDVAAAARAIERDHEHVQVLVCYQTLAAGLVGSRVRDRSGIPYVVWIRGRQEYRMNRPSRYRLLAPGIYAGAARVLVQTRPLAEEVLGEFDRIGLRRVRALLRERIRVLPNGVEIGAARAPSNGALVYAGRLIPAKGVDDLIAAMRDLPGQRLIVVGDGPDRSRLELLARDTPVEFTGRLPYDEARAHIGGALALVLPSHSEAFPNVVLEAMAEGVPVVARETPGTAALVEHGATGLLWAPGNREEMMCCLRRITAAPKLREAMGRRALEAARRYSWPEIADGLVRELVPILEPRARAASAQSIRTRHDPRAGGAE